MNPQPGVYGWSTGGGGVHYHRVAEPLRVAAAHGMRAATGNFMANEILERHDSILVHMLWDEKNSQAWEEIAAAGHHRMIFDIDDAMWAPDANDKFREHYTDEVMARVWRNVGLAHVITTPSPFIAEHVLRYNPNVWIVPNSVPAAALDLKMSHPTMKIGYQGSWSHREGVARPDFTSDEAAGILAACRENWPWKLHFWGISHLQGWPTELTGCTPWQKPGMAYYQSLAMDIGVAPVADTIFNRGKSSLRAIEYAALGIVGVFTDHELYRDWVTDGVTGVILKRNDEWYEAITDLIKDPDRLAGMSYAARRRAREWTTEAQINNWVQAWNSV